MPSQTPVRGTRRRQFVRDIVGKPGSLRRWLLGTTVWLFACLVLSYYLSWIARIFLFIFALGVPMVTYGARRMLVGDEDELRADLRRRRSGSPYVPVETDDTAQADEGWLEHSGDLIGAPRPPIMDDDEAGTEGGTAQEPVHADPYAGP